jgi:hypothetical protein
VPRGCWERDGPHQRRQTLDALGWQLVAASEDKVLLDGESELAAATGAAPAGWTIDCWRWQASRDRQEASPASASPSSAFSVVA